MPAKGALRRATLVVALVGLLAVLAAGCGSDLLSHAVTASGVAAEREVALGQVDEVAIGSSLRADVVAGDEASVRIRGDDNHVELIEVRETAGRVEVRVPSGYRLRGGDLRVDVTVPRLSVLEASGSSTVRLDGAVDVDDLRVSASGASDLDAGLDAGTVEARVSGASDVRLTGTAEHIEVRASGGSTLDAGQLASQTASVRASGASNVAVHADGSLDVRASGAARVRYTGDPALGSLSTSGGASVESR